MSPQLWKKAKNSISAILELDRRVRPNKTIEGSSVGSSDNQDVNTRAANVVPEPLNNGRSSPTANQIRRNNPETSTRNQAVVTSAPQIAGSSVGVGEALTFPGLELDVSPTSRERYNENSAVQEAYTKPESSVSEPRKPKSPDRPSSDREILFPPLKIGLDTRLVTIEKGTDIIHCKTRPVALHDEPEYVALSHVWGDPRELKNIFLNGRMFTIRAALHQALEELRKRRVGPVWIDNISIDQEDSQDKEQQIRKMRVIYSHATTVLAWLGPRFGKQDLYSDALYDGEAGIDFLGSKIFDYNVLPEPKEVKAVQEIVSRAYWTRCWIIQEICLAKKAILLCGSKSADFDTVWANLTELMSGAKFPYVGPEVKEHLDSLAYFRDQESAKTRAPQMALIDALLKTRLSKASEPRDKIFAILRLAHDGDRLVDTPNYTQPDDTIFWKLAHNMIHLQGHVAIILLARQAMTTSGSREWRPRSVQVMPTLRLVRTSSSDARRALERKETARLLPSWVPWWPYLDSDEDQLPEWIMRSIYWSNEGAPPATSHYGRTLCIRGWLLDRIVSVAGVPGLQNYAAPQPNPSSLASHQSPASFRPGTSASIGIQEINADSVTVGHEPVPPHRRTQSRKSTNSGKVFRNARDVFLKLRTALIALLSDQTARPQHLCGTQACLAKHDQGLATASVLHRDHDGQKAGSILTWWSVNKQLIAGEKKLEDWARQMVTETSNAASVPNYKTINKVPAQPMLCSLDQEVVQLSEAFEIMKKYRMRLAVTHRCTFKLVYCESRVNDYICRLEKCTLPVVLRPSGDLNITELHAEPEDMDMADEVGSVDMTRQSGQHVSHSVQSGSDPGRQKLECTYVGEAYRVHCDTDDEQSWTTQTDWKPKYFDPGAPERREFMIS